MAANTANDVTIRDIAARAGVSISTVHYALRRTMDIYVRPLGEDLGRIANAIDGVIAKTEVPEGLKVTLRGMVQGMRASFQSFALGLALSRAKPGLFERPVAFCVIAC